MFLPVKMTTFLFFVGLSFSSCFAEQKDELQDACSYVMLSAEEINELQSWDISNQVCIGVDENKSHDKTLVGNHHSVPKEWVSHLVNITFEKDEISVEPKLIADSFDNRHSSARNERKSMGASK